MAAYEDDLATVSWMEGLAAVDVKMGEMAWLDSKHLTHETLTSVGGCLRKDGVTDPRRPGLFTKGLASCFAVVILGPRGGILAHVSGYHGRSDPLPVETDECNTMKANFRRLWTKHFVEKKHLDPPTFVLVLGENTIPERMERAIQQIFPQLSNFPDMAPGRRLEVRCEKTPYPREAKHGKVLALMHYRQNNQVWVEEAQVF
jgi:hypothetical protein